MIANDQELKATVERVRRPQPQIANLRAGEVNLVNDRLPACAATNVLVNGQRLERLSTAPIVSDALQGR